jgi:xanthine dehydrogenase accessory factor
MADIIETLNRWLAEGESIAMATVINVDGSAPRAEGAKMLISRSGKIAGSVSGGCVESAVAEEAQAVLANGEPRIVRYGINRNMMWDVGLSCGGSIDVFIESLDRGLRPTFEPGVVACTIVRGPDRVGDRYQARHSAAKPFVDSDLLGGSLSREFAEGVAEAVRTGAARVRRVGPYDIFMDPQVPQPRLVIVGAVHMAVDLCEFASRAGFAVTVVDPRERLNNRERFPLAEHLAVGWPEDELPRLRFDENTYVAVLTHDEKFDDPTLDYVLRRNVRYVGAIGSKKTQALRRSRLIDSGIAVDAIERLHAPIGLDIGAELPEEIALAILAEMIAAKYGRRGTPLKDRIEQHIHA